MFNNLATKEFWFSYHLALSRADKWLLIIFIIMALLAFSFWMASWLSKKHPVTRRLLRRFFNGLLAFAVLGGIWGELRNLYIPIFGTRAAAGIILLIFLVWLFFPLKYLFFKFSGERKSWEQEQVKLKYLKA